jgi:hypothetical protein
MHTKMDMNREAVSKNDRNRSSQWANIIFPDWTTGEKMAQSYSPIPWEGDESNRRVGYSFPRNALKAHGLSECLGLEALDVHGRTRGGDHQVDAHTGAGEFDFRRIA